MTILLFLIILFFLVLVHELGHFLVAKWSKMKVEEFAIGFPPRLFSRVKGETAYSFNLLPLGGYVKILGENGEDEIAPKDRARSFGARPRYLQALVLVAGVTMNILIAWVIFFAVALIGQPTVVDETTAGPDAVLTITGILPDSPAAKAEIPLGAKVVALEAGDETLAATTPGAFVDFVSKHQNETLILTYESHQETKSVALKGQAGVVVNEPERKAIGLSAALVETERLSLPAALVDASVRTYDTLSSILLGVLSLFASIFALSANLSEVAGPIGIANLVGEAASFGIIPLLTFTAFISLNLAIINLLPIPALDGGRLLFVLIEAIIRRPIHPVWQSRVNFAGFALLMLLMVAVTFNDIVKII